MTIKSFTHYLDLDHVFEELPSLAVKIGNEVHEFQHTTVEGFIANTKLMQDLEAVGSSFEREFDVTVQIVARAFPTLTMDKLKKLTFVQLNKLVDFSRKASGELAEASAAAATVSTGATAVSASAAAASTDAIKAADVLAAAGALVSPTANP